MYQMNSVYARAACMCRNIKHDRRNINSGH